MDAPLKPYSIQVDLDLAEDYLRKNEQLWTADEKTSTDEESPLIKVETRNFPVPSSSAVFREKFLELAELIQENAKLFSQLEFLRRGIHPEEVMCKDIKLLLQNLQYISKRPNVKTPVYSILNGMPKEMCWLREPLEITEDVPLAHLGFITQQHHRHYRPKIHSTLTSAAVCTLFAQLCEKVGLDIQLYIAKNPLDNTVQVPEGCTGVIAECSDLDSAVDTFLSSSTKYPWKLTRILVQESVYERFQNVLDYKCKLKGDSEPAHLQSCSKAFVYGDKTMLLDFSGDYDQFNEKSTGDTSDKVFSYVLVEAYRTTKELLSMIQNYGASYVSLWCSDISEANEIAFNVNSRAVWINDYALFNGPAVSSQVYYGFLKPTYKTNIENIVLSVDKWSKLSQDTREKLLRKCIKKFAENETDEISQKFIDDVQKLMFSDSHLTVGTDQGSVCVVERKLSGVSMLVICCSDKNVLPHISEAISALRYGSGICYDYVETLRPINEVAACVNKLFQIMNAENVPVAEDIDMNEPRPDVDYYEIKAVWTSFGTVFAN